MPSFIFFLPLYKQTTQGIDIATRPNSTIVTDPPLQEAASLQVWYVSLYFLLLDTNTFIFTNKYNHSKKFHKYHRCDENKAYIEKVISQRLYEKMNQKVVAPVHTQIRPISQILGSSELVKYIFLFHALLPKIYINNLLTKIMICNFFAFK